MVVVAILYIGALAPLSTSLNTNIDEAFLRRSPSSHEMNLPYHT
jgi:hypothetical protein